DDQETLGSVWVEGGKSPMRVSVDGVFIGVAPVKYELSAGHHEVTLQSAIDPKKSVRHRIRISAGQQYRILDKEVATEPVDSQKLYDAAQAAYVRGDYDEAASKAQDCLAVLPDAKTSEHARKVLIVSRCALRDEAGARESFSQLVDNVARNYARYVCA